VVCALDAYRIITEVGIEVFLQHADGTIDGAKTGKISIEQAKKIGVVGSLLNHSEDRMIPGTIKKQLALWPSDFKSVACIQTLGQMERWARNIKPNFIAYEPSELIGSKDKSVASENPEAIKKVADFYKGIPVLVGAGVHSKVDVMTSLKLGAKGILVATDVVKAKDPEKELRELADGFNTI
jgi:triosephosphate isomerase